MKKSSPSYPCFQAYNAIASFFSLFISGMMQKQAEDEAEIASNPKSSKARDQSMKRKNVVIVDEEPKTKSKGGCC